MRRCCLKTGNLYAGVVVLRWLKRRVEWLQHCCNPVATLELGVSWHALPLFSLVRGRNDNTRCNGCGDVRLADRSEVSDRLTK